MLDANPREFTAPASNPSADGPRLRRYLSRHLPILVLLGTLAAQLLLLSFQITRNHDVRLIRVWAVAILDPFERGLGRLVDDSTQAWRTYQGLWQAHQQNQELHLQLVAARTELQQVSEKAGEAERLRTLLEFKNRFPYQTVAAEVIATSPGEGNNAVFIDKGTDYSLTADLAVITPNGIVGKTIAVFPHTAQVLLITDSASGVGCLLEKSRIQGILKGSTHSLCQLQYVMNEEQIPVGETLITSGLDQIYPKGLPVGAVVQTGDGNIYKQIIIKPAATLNRLETVLVIPKLNSGQQQALNRLSRP
jgi:rod shape-determining protein MreC